MPICDLRRLIAVRTDALLLAAAVLPGVASAQLPTPNNNCDITHQQIHDTHNAGAVGGVNGYAWGSFTCNVGTNALAWRDGDTPALAMNAFRLHDGRLVQIGLGFAKHACCVGNSSGCGNCTFTGQQGLQPGCRDVYNAGFNASQSRLGPRSGIDPYLGTFTPIAPLPPSPTVIFRKVQVAQTAMNAATYSGALYFAEGLYVCAEEQPERQLNNASWRRMNVANGGATPTYAWSVIAGSPTVSQEPAIFAWRAHGLGIDTPDPEVAIVSADIPGDGRFFAAGKARDLSGTGAGPWRYDYAVYNLNSARAAAGVSIPVPAGVEVTDIGFHDVDYHSGEIYDNTDWMGSRAASSVEFEGAQFASAPTGNALRWGTMYNFWFTADVPPDPATGAITLDLFKPAPPNPDSVLIAGLPVPGPAQPACPADFNGVGGVTVQDIFDFLAAYFAGGPGADFNGAGGITVQDIFDFLAAYFTGCP